LDAVNLEVFYRVNIQLEVENEPWKYPLRAKARVRFHDVPLLGSISSTSVRKSSLSTIDRAVHSTSRWLSHISGYPVQLDRWPGIKNTTSDALGQLYPKVLDFIIENELYGFQRANRVSNIQKGILIASFGFLLAWQYLFSKRKL